MRVKRRFALWGHAARQYLRRPLSLVLYLAVRLAALATVGVFIALVGYILIKGVPHLSLDLFSPSTTPGTSPCCRRW